MNPYHDYAEKKLVASYNNGHPLQPLFQRAFEAAMAGNPSILEGYIQTALLMIKAPHGVRFSGEAKKFINDPMDYMLEFNMQVSSGKRQNAATMIGVITGSLEGLRVASKGAHMTLTREEPKPEAQEVKIVAMPERITKTDVVRDSNNEIVETHQHQYDAPLS